MRDLRWVEGRDYMLEARYADGVGQALPSLAADLVSTRPDLVLTTDDDTARVLMQASKTMPVVFTIAQDPVGNGIAASLRRPDGNATGLTSLATELAAKRLQLLKNAFPRVSHVALFFEPDAKGSASQAREIEKAAQGLGMRITLIELRQPTDVDLAFRRATTVGAHAYIVTQGGTTNSQRQKIVDRTIELKVPAMFPVGQWVEAGGLMSYSTSFSESFRRASIYVDKILRGASPSELPIEQPTKFELVVNMKTAKALGFTFTDAFMAGVDRVVD
jgi:putative ABC transport system substrate-binding protein